MPGLPYHRSRPHPWHGLPVGPRPPEIVNAYIEITPFDVVKYEIDKASGYLSVDRPQRGASTPPTLYGFIPRTLCAARVGALSPSTAGGDGDPMDVCVISERPITRAEVIAPARVVGGFRMVDGGEADDKIVAVLASDPVWDDIEDATDLPRSLLDRLRHYFATYKLFPGSGTEVDVGELYDRARALEVILASVEDYDEAYGASHEPRATSVRVAASLTTAPPAAPPRRARPRS